jgi:7-cyano-7-deazaguanine reductase
MAMHTKSDDVTEGLKALGAGSLPQVEGPSGQLLEAFPNRFPGRPYVVTLSYPEFSSLCPVTGQPDTGVVTVEYVPAELCLESKSFKLYMVAFRNHRSFMETIVNTVLDDLWACMRPCWCRIKGLFAPRGGVCLHVFAEKTDTLAPDRLSIVETAVRAWKAEADPHRP